MQIEFFSKVKDPRVLGKVRHELEDVLRIALIGVLCSCEDYDEISDLIEDSQQEFKDMGFLRLTNGVPSGDTIRRVWRQSILIRYVRHWLCVETILYPP